MSNLMESIYNKAKSLGKNIVLPESEDKRVVEAAALCAQQNIAKITLLGDENKIKAENPGIDLTGVTVINPETNTKTNEYAQLLFNLRQGKINKKNLIQGELALAGIAVLIGGFGYAFTFVAFFFYDLKALYDFAIHRALFCTVTFSEYHQFFPCISIKFSEQACKGIDLPCKGVLNIMNKVEREHISRLGVQL